VYKVNAAGKETVLYSFTGGTDGAKPEGDVILATSGNLYGTTTAGGAANAGVVYKIDPMGNETVLYSFTGKLDGATPQSGLIRDASGNLYGTTYYGGVYNLGVLFMLSAAGRETVLYSFMGGAQGSGPSGAIVRDDAGNFYGTTQYGGTTLRDCSHPPTGCGVVYKLNPAGYETVLHTFTLGSDGGVPYGGLIRDAEGSLFGTTYYGGTSGYGTVFKVSATGHETILYSFAGGDDGANPEAGVIADANGSLYGTTYYGGGTDAGGTVYKLTSAGQETVLHSFKSYSRGPDGYFPIAGLALDAAGNLYGTTLEGGPALFGALYKLSTTGQETILSCFMGAAAGNNPQGGVIRDDAGNLYGTTYFGGGTNSGVVYKIDAAGDEAAPFAFPGGAAGANPVGDLIRDAAGNLYGITLYGGNGVIEFDSGGVVFKIDASGSETVLYTFPAYVDPQPGLARDAAGNLYGTTFEGGKAGCYGNRNCGLVYKLNPAGQVKTLYEFTGGPDGANPNGGLILDAEGNLYGTTAAGGAASPDTPAPGVVYKLAPDGSETVLYNFENGGGGTPDSGLVRDAAGNFYGTTQYGGTETYGVVFKIDPAGNETVLYNFTVATYSSENPFSSLAIDAEGNLYGTSVLGGIAGVVYQVTPSGDYTVLYSFTGGADGGTPDAPVTLDSAGNLYGTTSAGGTGGGGVIFKLEGVAAATPGGHR
jgi:uncharacterized repeat protein (TIGR03803 family)